MDDALISWRDPIKPLEGTPPVDIPGRNKDRKAASTWRDLVLDLGASDRLLEPVSQEQRPKCVVVCLNCARLVTGLRAAEAVFCGCLLLLLLFSALL